MSDERTVLNPATGESTSLEEALKKDLPEHIQTRAEKKAKLASILNRGLTVSRLHLNLPSGMYGEWVHNSAEEIHRMEAMGFAIDKTQNVKPMHDQGDASTIVGDVILMTCEAETKELIDEIRREEYTKKNGAPGEKRRSQEEERMAAASITKSSGGELPVFDESSELRVRKAQIEDALLQRKSARTAVEGTPIK